MSTLNVQKQFFETKRKLGILNLKKTLNKVLLMAGTILAIAVLTTGAIVSEAEAKPFSDRENSGIVANCRVDHVGTTTIICAFSDKDGIRKVVWIHSNENETERDVECDKRFKDKVQVGEGDLQIMITDCANNSVPFCYHNDGKKLTELECPP